MSEGADVPFRDVSSLRFRRGLLELLTASGRTEEARLVECLGLLLHWDAWHRLILCDLEEENSGSCNCPYRCGFGFQPQNPRWCSHIVVAAPSYHHPTVDSLPQEVRAVVARILVEVVSIGMSPVVTEPGSLRCLRPIRRIAGMDLPKEGALSWRRDGGYDIRYEVVYAERPPAFLTQLANLVRQRTVAGYPIR